MSDLDAKAAALEQATQDFDLAAELIKSGHRALAEAGENNCKTKQWLRAAVTIASTLAETAQRGLTATRKTIDLKE